MTVLYRCLAVLGIGIASVLVSSTGEIAHAAPPKGYEYVEAGPFASLAYCNTVLAEENSPPTVIVVSACGYFTSNPMPMRSFNNGPGWYFLKEVNIE